jgi:hypothetical protein
MLASEQKKIKIFESDTVIICGVLVAGTELLA